MKIKNNELGKSDEKSMFEPLTTRDLLLLMHDRLKNKQNYDLVLEVIHDRLKELHADDHQKLITVTGFTDRLIKTDMITRKPTDVEIQEFVISYLKNMKYKGLIQSTQYRSAKGQYRHGYPDYCIRFMTNRDSSFMEQYQSFINTETLHLNAVLNFRIQ